MKTKTICTTAGLCLFGLFACTLTLCGPTIAQNTFPANGSVGIGTTSPAASALLEIISIAKGVLIPRMTLAQRNAIASPATACSFIKPTLFPVFTITTGLTGYA